MFLPLLESSMGSYLLTNDGNYNLDKLIIRYNGHPITHTSKSKCTELNSTFTYQKVVKEQISILI